MSKFSIRFIVYYINISCGLRVISVWFLGSAIWEPNSSWVSFDTHRGVLKSQIGKSLWNKKGLFQPGVPSYPDINILRISTLVERWQLSWAKHQHESLWVYSFAHELKSFLVQLGSQMQQATHIVQPPPPPPPSSSAISVHSALQRTQHKLGPCSKERAIRDGQEWRMRPPKEPTSTSPSPAFTGPKPSLPRPERSRQAG